MTDIFAQPTPPGSTAPGRDILAGDPTDQAIGHVQTLLNPAPSGWLGKISSLVTGLVPGLEGTARAVGSAIGLPIATQMANEQVKQAQDITNQALKLPHGDPQRTALLKKAGDLLARSGAAQEENLGQTPTPKEAAGSMAELGGSAALYGGSLAAKVPGLLGTAARSAEMGGLVGLMQAAGNVGEGKPAGQGMGTAITVGALMPPLFEGGAKILGSIASKLPDSLINKLIKPLSKDFLYGKDPGRGIVDEGIVAKDMTSLKNQVLDAIKQRGAEIGAVYDNPILAKNITVDASDALKPIDDAIAKAQESPRTNAGLITRLQNARLDILKAPMPGEQGAVRTLTDLTPKEAFDLKDDVGDLTRWTGAQSDDDIVNKALAQTYRNIDSKLDTAVPGLKDMNAHYADLKSALNSVNHREIQLKKANFIGLAPTIAGGGAALWSLAHGDYKTAAAELAGAGAYEALSSTAGRTILAKLIDSMAPGEKAAALREAPILKRLLGPGAETAEEGAALPKGEGPLGPGVQVPVRSGAGAALGGTDLAAEVPVHAGGSMQVGLTSAQPANPKVAEQLQKANDLFASGNYEGGIAEAQKVTEATRGELEATLNDGSTNIDRLETNTHGLYFGNPEPSYWLQVSTKDKDVTLGSLAKFAQANRQESFITAEVAKTGTPGGKYLLPKDLSAKQVQEVQAIFNDSGIGITLNQKTGEVVTYNINQFDGMEPTTYLMKLDAALEKLDARGYDFKSAGAEFDNHRIGVYTAADYEGLIQKGNDARGVQGEMDQAGSRLQTGKAGLDAGGLSAAGAAAISTAGFPKSTEVTLPKVGTYKSTDTSRGALDAHAAVVASRNDLPPALLTAVLEKESSYGTNTKNKANDVGKYGWLVGFTKTAAKEFDRLGMTYNTNTVKGAIQAAADYLNLMQKRFKTSDPVELYMRYNGTNSPGVRSKFQQIYEKHSTRLAQAK